MVDRLSKYETKTPVTASASGTFGSMPATGARQIDQIEQGIEKDPDDVDEMPVETGHFNGVVVVLRVRSFPHFRRDPRHETDADDHVERMDPGHREIEEEEDLRVRRVDLCRIEGEGARSGNQVMV